MRAQLREWPDWCWMPSEVTSLWAFRRTEAGARLRATRPRQARRSTSENTNPVSTRRRGAIGTPLAPHLAGLLDEYREALDRAPLSPESRRTYLSKVRQLVAWLAAADVDGDPLATQLRGTGPSATTAPTCRRSPRRRRRP